ncbi:MAG: DUF4416 family protein [Candidatus Omnitrophica bacterium]|nr:DUF4416 family protein [Candidatus Omnitrophota bacterium]
MGKAKKPKQVKLVVGILAKDKKLFDIVEEFLTDKFGEIDYRSPVIDFTYSDYYKKEMGEPLKKRFISFKKLISPEALPKIKTLTNSLENKFSQKDNSELKRRVNLDPGYISDSKFVLATTKDYSHRLYLSKGIYAEITLTWRKGGFQPLDWTYPDYRTKDYINTLSTIRNALTSQNCNAL